MASIFDNIRLIGESSVHTDNRNDIHPIYTEGSYINDCSCFVTDDLIQECYGDYTLVEQSAILEGAKFDLALKNFLKEGKDYKGLKAAVKEVIRANDLPRDDLKTGKNGFMHAIKRILQVLQDVSIITGSIQGVAQLFIVSGNPILFISTLVGFVVGVFINRLLRYAYDTIEFNAMKDDAEEVISMLEANASKAKDPKLKKRYNDEANKVREALKKYSK